MSMFLYSRTSYLQDITSQRNLGAILHLMGRFREARSHYEAALELVPGDPQTLTNLQRLKALTAANIRQ